MQFSLAIRSLWILRKGKTVEPDGDNTDTGSQAKKIHFSTSNDDDEPGFENWDLDISEIPLDSTLKFASKSLFRLLKALEKEIQNKLDVGQMFRPNSFTKILSSLVENELPQVGCCDHKEIFMTNIIMDFMCCRMKCLAKEKRLAITEEKRVKQKATRKKKKLNKYVLIYFSL